MGGGLVREGAFRVQELAGGKNFRQPVAPVCDEVDGEENGEKKCCLKRGGRKEGKGENVPAMEEAMTNARAGTVYQTRENSRGGHAAQKITMRKWGTHAKPARGTRNVHTHHSPQHQARRRLARAHLDLLHTARICWRWRPCFVDTGIYREGSQVLCECEP